MSSQPECAGAGAPGPTGQEGLARPHSWVIEWIAAIAIVVGSLNLALHIWPYVVIRYWLMAFYSAMFCLGCALFFLAPAGLFVLFLRAIVMRERGTRAGRRLRVLLIGLGLGVCAVSFGAGWDLNPGRYVWLTAFRNRMKARADVAAIRAWLPTVALPPHGEAVERATWPPPVKDLRPHAVMVGKREGEVVLIWSAGINGTFCLTVWQHAQGGVPPEEEHYLDMPLEPGAYVWTEPVLGGLSRSVDDQRWKSLTTP